jgi:hypothetical protein
MNRLPIARAVAAPAAPAPAQDGDLQRRGPT